MEKWKSHVLAELFRRDRRQNDPFTGLLSSYSRLLEKCELRERLLEDHQRSSSERNENWDQAIGEPLQLYLQLKDSEQTKEKLSQTISDLTTTMFLREAELQYCHSKVSRYRQEAIALARNSVTLQETLSECEFALERQSKELVAVQSERRELTEELARVQKEKEKLLERWLEEKREEADRVNQSNNAQERWYRFTNHLTRHFRNKNRTHCEETTEGQCHCLGTPPEDTEN